MTDVITRKPRILVVDDSAQMTTLIAAWLSDLGDVSVAHSGEEAYVVAHQLRPEVIVLDILLPQLSGFAVMETLRHDPSTANAQVIFITGLDQPANFYRAGEFGAPILRKPLEEHVLRAAVVGALADHSGEVSL